jgi:hypothetical protein
MYTFAAVAVAFPLYVLVRSIINLARATDGYVTIIIKALLVLGVWLVVSFTFIFIPIMYLFEPGTTDRAAAERRITIMVLVFTFLYIVIALLLGYWIRLQPGWKTLRKARNEA